MLPLKDHRVPRRLPLVTWTLVVLNLGVFLLEVRGLVPVARLALVPARPLAAAGAPWITHAFLHGSWLHVLGNLWFLLLFGDDVEERLGRRGFLAFYLLAGLAAAATHALALPASAVPMLGASGAVAGVLGAYLVLHPRNPVTTLVFIVPLRLPAWVPLGVWAVLQVVPAFTGVGTLAATAQGVAWWAHVGGLAVGAGWMAVVTAGVPSPGRGA